MPLKKVVFVLTSLRRGGAEGKAQKLIYALSEHYQIELLVFNDAIEYDLPSGVNTKILGSRISFLRGTWLQLPLIFLRYLTYLRRSKVQASFSYGYIPNILCLMSRRFGWSGKALINHINNTGLELNQTSGWKGVIKKVLISKYYQKANAIIAPSEGLRQDLLINFGVSAEKVNLIHNPLELNTIDKMCAEPVNVNLNEDNTFVFIHVGNHRPQKNHRLLLESFAEIRNKATVLWLLGKGSDDESLKDMVRELGIGTRVRFFGMVQNPYAFMTKANCLVLSSNYEGLPNVVLEALACRLPVISTDCQYGPREILAPKTDFRKQTQIVELCEFGILTPVNDATLLRNAMEMIVTSPDVVNVLKKSVRQRAEDFEIKHLLNLYFKLIG